jgi:hypothetical protein
MLTDGTEAVVYDVHWRSGAESNAEYSPGIWNGGWRESRVYCGGWGRLARERWEVAKANLKGDSAGLGVASEYARCRI